MPKPVQKQTMMEDLSSEDEDEALEMEKNFALITQRTLMNTSAGDDGEDAEDGEEDDGEDAEDDAEDDGEDAEDAEDVQDAQDDGEDAEDDGEDAQDGDEDEDDAQDGDEDAEMSGSDEDESDAREEAVREGGSSMTSQAKGFKTDLSSMSFEEIMKLQNKVGTKAYKKIAYGSTREEQHQNTETKKRLNRHKPQEISAKKHVPYLRQVIPVKKNILRDPRFDDLSGEYKPEVFAKTYRFIDDIREQEMQIVRKKMKKAKSDERKEELKALLKRLENQQRARQRQENNRDKELQFKKKVREMVGQGHKPFYLKKSDMKKMELAEKYSDLKRSGKLENFLSKKRKRNATKDRRKLPKQHLA